MSQILEQPLNNLSYHNLINLRYLYLYQYLYLYICMYTYKSRVNKMKIAKILVNTKGWTLVKGMRLLCRMKKKISVFPGGSVVRSPPTNARNTSSIPDVVRSHTSIGLCTQFWAGALEHWSCNYWAHALQRLKPVCLEPVFCNRREHCKRETCVS